MRVLDYIAAFLKLRPEIPVKDAREIRRENPKSTADCCAGEQLQGLVATEFWLGEELVDAFCVVFVKTGKGICRLSWNDDPEWWELEETGEFPEPGQVPFDPALGDEHFRYPVTDLAARHELTGEKILSFTVQEDPEDKADLAILRLASGRELRWSYRLKTEETTLEILKVSA
ncbi:hypothetical protein [Denitrobaculum tricleocarpae]|uniref:Uncharacterized protein n=1 Tax=Denitrobaculum tricleocarpae TaxID=2591009 RepID=A0A545TFX6_9PROT|nr:hypothetical protein [Denitrobaculum tricleocarpae]TQV76105.1 hypothetical protein FKG95_20885 [Denitrobaculum tricleocarpae]